MITLNLLPAEEKQLIASQKSLREINFYGLLGLLSIFFFLVLLGIIWLYLLIQLNSADRILKEVQSSSQSKAFNDFKEGVKQTNDELKYIDQLASQENDYSPILKNLFGLLPPGVKTKSVSLNGNKVELSGNAVDRQAVVSLRDVLEKSPDFQKLDSPLSNFLKQSNIDFYFTFEIKKP